MRMVVYGIYSNEGKHKTPSVPFGDGRASLGHFQSEASSLLISDPVPLQQFFFCERLHITARKRTIYSEMSFSPLANSSYHFVLWQILLTPP
jgi:hypothetical protein